MQDVLKDLRHGIRLLARSPGFAGLVVLTLALGIGANTAIFSLIHGVLLKPLPYTDGDRLLLIRQSASLLGIQNTNVSIREYFTYREQAKDFESLVEHHQMSFDLLNQGEPDRVSTSVVSHNFFEVLGITPLLGRTFRESDDRPGADAVLLLSHAYWTTRFGADPDIIGRVFEMNDRPHTVIGVLPDVPMYPQTTDVYMPVLACPFRAAAERNIDRNPRTFSALTVFGRLRPAAPPERATSDVEAICARFSKEDPKAYRANAGFAATAVDVRNELTQNARPMLLILLGTTGLVLLLACANVSNLMLARLLRRDRELAVRSALGASRGRLIRQLLAESVLLAAAGGAIGLAFAWGTLGMLTTFTARFTQRTQEIGIDPWVLAFTLALAVAAGVVFGTVPAFTARVDLSGALNQGTRGAGGGTPRRRVQSTLVVVQVAISVVLLVGASLLLVSFLRLQRVDPGYRAERVLSAETFGNFSRYPDAKSLLAFYLPLLERLQSEPGIVSAAVTNAVPLSAIQPGRAPLQIEGLHQGDSDDRPRTDVRTVSSRFFETLGVPLMQGRFFAESDDRETQPVAIVSSATTRFWQGREPIGSRISMNGGQAWATVVGVVGDVRMFGLDQDAGAQVYVPLRQGRGLAGRVLVRTAGDPDAAAATIERVVRSLDPQMPIENVRTLTDLRDRHLATPRLTAALLAIFAGLALVVTLAGLVGVIATSVSQRTQEFGVRMALGARRSEVLRMVVAQGLLLVALGLAVGIAASLAAGRLLSAFLYQTAATDPVALAVVSVTFLLAGVLACLGPAWRATTIDPMIALRAE
ncbi:MAG TPA: ABC transporter permease [Vicinamibacterales bacterium]|nr:ABC transporter permease [Vicinamibacterales bacterium]